MVMASAWVVLGRCSNPIPAGRGMEPSTRSPMDLRLRARRRDGEEEEADGRAERIGWV